MAAFYKNRILAVADLLPNARNARTHSDAQIAQIAASISEFGFTNPVLIDENNSVLAGHGRLLAARTLGMVKVPVILVTGLNDAQKRALMLADNKVALNAGWDLALLRLELGELRDEGVDLLVTGFSDDELAELKIVEEDLMQVGGVGDGSALTTASLKWGDKVVPLSDQEVSELNAAFARHYAENGVAFGFVRQLLNPGRDV